jgi:hypothetical protein
MCHSSKSKPNQNPANPLKDTCMVLPVYEFKILNSENKAGMVAWHGYVKKSI